MFLGLKKTEFFRSVFTAVICATTLILGCDAQPKRPLAAPGTLALLAAKNFKKSHPSAQITFSQTTGEVLWINDKERGLHEATSGAPPLDAEKALAQITRFMEENPDLYRIASPATSLRLTRNGFRISSVGGGTLLRFEQTRNGIPLRGKASVAFFSSAGTLIALQTQIVPDESFQTALTPSDMPTSSSSALYSWDSLDGLNYALFAEEVTRHPHQVTRTIRDLKGKIIQTRDETPNSWAAAPENWQSDGALVRVAAMDDLSRIVPSIYSTRIDERLVLGFHIPEIHAEGASVQISDAEFGSSSYKKIITTDQPNWTLEPLYEGGYRDATMLAVNLEKTLHWFHDHFGYASWDGRGSTLYAAIRGNIRTDGLPWINARGHDGFLLIGDGHVGANEHSQGQALSEALDVVAHEFTHSVIDATAHFELYGESGALSESLADFFGKSVEGYPDTLYGKSIGWSIRDLLHPAKLGQPERYSEYATVNADNEGVHLNSGIMSRALSVIVLGEKGIVDRGFGPVPVAAFLLEALREVPFNTASRMEDFSAALLQYCQNRHHELCPALESSFLSSELLTPAI